MPLVLSPETSALVVIDFQERLFAAMPEARRARALTCATNLVWLAGELGVPVLASEQYPEGLGPTLAALRIETRIPKLVFSAAREPAFGKALVALGRPTIVVTGMETHICVAQTCRDLAADGFVPVLAADACLSRTELDWQLGCERVREDGGRVVTTEAVLFEWLGRAGGPRFKELSRRVR
jgi:nicotinamidase-related amidase